VATPHDTISAEVHSANLVIVTLQGEHDLASNPEVDAALAIGGDQRSIIVDLSRCTFIDSTIIGALLKASYKRQERGGQLALVMSADGHRAVRSVFELMSLERLMPIFESRATALRHVETAASATKLSTARLRALSEIIDLSLTATDEQHRAA
jgi:anti-anti-sigma factor